MNLAEQVTAMLRWGKAKEVQTKYGPRLLSKAKPGPDWRTFYHSNEQDLRSIGVSMSEDRNTGEWEVLWWQKLPKINSDVPAKEATKTVECQGGTLQAVADSLAKEGWRITAMNVVRNSDWELECMRADELRPVR